MSSYGSGERRIETPTNGVNPHRRADFGRSDPETFALGKTTEKEIRQRFGEPSSQSTAQVRDNVGKPTGQFIYPSPYVWAPDQRAIVYSYSRNDRLPPGGTLQTISKFLDITFDSRDVVAETSLTTTATSRALR